MRLFRQSTTLLFTAALFSANASLASAINNPVERNAPEPSGSIPISNPQKWLDTLNTYRTKNNKTLTAEQSAIFDKAEEIIQKPNEEKAEQLMEAAERELGPQVANALFVSNRLPDEAGSEKHHKRDGCGAYCECSTKSGTCDGGLPCVLYTSPDRWGCVGQWSANCCGPFCQYGCDGRCGHCPGQN